MPGLKDLWGDLAKNAIERKDGKEGIVKELIKSAAGDKAAEFINEKVAPKLNQALGKVGVKDLDGKILIKLPFMKSVDERSEEALSVHPEWNKICAHLYDNSVRNEAVFYDLDGNELYKIDNSGRSFKHICLLKGGAVVGEVQKKLIMLKNPLSVSEPYKYTVTVRGKELGTVEIKDLKWKPAAIPDFASWTMADTHSLRYDVTNESGKVIAAVHDVTENKYVFDYSDAFDPELLILTFIAIQMRDEDKRSKR